MKTHMTRLLPLCTFILAAIGLHTAAADQAEGPTIGASRDEMSFTVPFPARRYFSGNGQVIFLLLIGPVAETRIIDTDFVVNFYSDGTTPASDLHVEIEVAVDEETRLFVLRGSELGFGSGPGMHRGTLSTHDLDGLVWANGPAGQSTIDMVIETESGGPIEGTAFFVSSSMRFSVMPADATVITEDFEDLTNDAGWSYYTGNEFIQETGGNPGAFLHDPFVASAIPSLATADGVASDFTGDYAGTGVIGLGVDLKSFAISSPAAETLSLVLWNDNGTPFDYEDDWGAYIIGDKPVPPVVAGPNAAGWFTYDFHVPARTQLLPRGWNTFGGMRSSDWSALMADVSGVAYYYGDPSVPHIFRQWDVGADNPRIYSR